MAGCLRVSCGGRTNIKFSVLLNCAECDTMILILGIRSLLSYSDEECAEAAKNATREGSPFNDSRC